MLADPALPDLLHRRLRDGPLPVPHAPTASGWSNFSRVGLFLLLDQDALSRRTAPPIYSVSLLTKLRCALAGNGLLRLADVRSFLARICQMQKPTKMMKKSEKTRQGLYNVGFIGIENSEAVGTRVRENETTLFENSLKTSAPAHITENS